MFPTAMLTQDSSVSGPRAVGPSSDMPGCRRSGCCGRRSRRLRAAAARPSSPPATTRWSAGSTTPRTSPITSRIPPGTRPGSPHWQGSRQPECRGDERTGKPAGNPLVVAADALAPWARGQDCGAGAGKTRARPTPRPGGRQRLAVAACRPPSGHGRRARGRPPEGGQLCGPCPPVAREHAQRPRTRRPQQPVECVWGCPSSGKLCR